MSPLYTPLCQLLGIELPIIQAPIGNATCPALVTAVSNADGLGMLSVTRRDVATIRQTIREIRQLTDSPFGINLVLYWPTEERLKACLEEGVPAVSFFWGEPSPYIPVQQHAHALGNQRVSPGGARPGEGEGVANWANGTLITRYSAELPGPEVTGEVEAMALYAKQSTGLVSHLQLAQTIVKEMADEAIRTLQRCMQFLPKDNAS